MKPGFLPSTVQTRSGEARAHAGVPAAIPFPVPDPHFAYVGMRHRNSGLTCVRWYDDETLYAGDFAAKRVYRVKPYSSQPIDAEIPTLDGEGRPTETDLMDLRGDCMVMSNFYTGEIGVYAVGPGVLRLERTFRIPSVRTDTRPPTNKPLHALRRLFGRSGTQPDRREGRRAHGVLFVPGYDDLLWISMCDAMEKGIEIVTLDGKPLHSLPTGEQAQDVAFMHSEGSVYAIQAARTNHITVDAPNQKAMYVTIYVYRLPDDLRAQPPELLVTRRFSGHLDALKFHAGAVYAANQHDSCVDRFEYSPRDNEIRLTRRIEGFDMPHGLDIRHDGLMAVTNYGPANELRFHQLD